jgi:hypothetical protein
MPKVVEGQRLLTDGRNFLCVSRGSAGDATFVRRGINAPGYMLGAIAEAFDTRIVSEHEPEYLGFASEEEWDAACKQEAEESQREFYAQIRNFLQGKPHDLRPGTIGMAKAEIARRLVDANPDLAGEAREVELRSSVEAIYERDSCAQAVTVEFSEAEIAALEAFFVTGDKEELLKAAGPTLVDSVEKLLD